MVLCELEFSGVVVLEVPEVLCAIAPIENIRNKNDVAIVNFFFIASPWGCPANAGGGQIGGFQLVRMPSRCGALTQIQRRGSYDFAECSTDIIRN
jgi:hypothetical protein